MVAVYDNLFFFRDTHDSTCLFLRYAFIHSNEIIARNVSKDLGGAIRDAASQSASVHNHARHHTQIYYVTILLQKLHTITVIRTHAPSHPPVPKKDKI